MMNWLRKLNAIQATDTIDLVRKADYSTKIIKIEKKIHYHDKYITVPEFNNLTKENFAERLEQANLASKNDIAELK